MWSPHENTILNRIAVQLEQSESPPPDAAALREFVLSLTKSGSRPMYDLCALAKDAYYHVATRGSVSIKKVLPAMLASCTWLRQHYAAPIYGAAQGIPSLNYQDFSWCPSRVDGSLVTDPYELLRNAGTDLLGEPVLPGQDPDAMVIAEGGAAATAYARLQFETLPGPSADRIKTALLRYCELDTLAMVMVVQGWQHLLSQDTANRPV